MHVTWWALDVGQINMISIFSLLYFRVKILRTTIENFGFDKVPMKQYSPRSYVRMYENERERSELQFLVDVMDALPLQYNIWRIIPFTAPVILAFFSLCTINFMAIVQIKTYM
ncbi:uncharacterized protein LOC142982977 [Anticarsia gemmatalis]|uniref:uncharacterized protein LOC142982977 n=1 Tax=Anticarsia gemmatalis TaxID=129554 RepID=UPI003F758144